MSYVPQSQNHNLLSPTSPPQTPLGDSDSEPPPLPDRKRATFKFPTVHRRSPFSSPRGSPRTSPAPSPRHSPYNSPRTSPVGSPMGLPRKLPPPLPPSDYPIDSDQPPMIPPKPQLSDSIRKTYQFRRVNSNPHGIKDNDSRNSLTKQLSKSHDQLHFSGTEDIDEQVQSLPNENENEIRSSGGAKIKESAHDLEDRCVASEGSDILSDCIDTSAGSSEERRTDREKRRQGSPQEICSASCYPPPVPMHRVVEGGEPPFSSQKFSSSARFSEGADGYDEFPDETNMDIEQHLRDNDRIEISLQTRRFIPLHGEVGTQPGVENDFVTEQPSVNNSEILGAKKRTNMSENKVINESERRNVFPNMIYETLYPGEETDYNTETVSVISHEAKVRPEHQLEDRRKSCPMLLQKSNADENVPDRRSLTLDRFTSNSLVDSSERDLRFPDPQRPVPLPPGTTRKDFEIKYSVERKDGCFIPEREDGLNEERDMDDFESGTKAKNEHGSSSFIEKD